jgi:protein SCO1
MVRRLGLLASVLVVTASCATTADPASVDTGVDPIAGQELASSPVLGESVAEVTLPDVSRSGTPFTMVAPDGGVLVVYFGYTFCPDICPTTLSDVRSALAAMGDDAERVEVAMVTVDPERDVDAVIGPYLQSFVPDGHALRTEDPTALAAAGDAFGADFHVITTSNGAIEVTHTAYLYAVDDIGTIRIVWPFGAEPDRIASDLETLLGAS